jgi:hypothetical protein
MVEFIIVLPIMLLLVFFLAWAGVGFERYARVTNAARVAARAATVARFDGKLACVAAQEAAVDAMGGLTLDGPAECLFNPDDQPGAKVTVTVRYTLPSIPIISGITGDVVVSGSATERLE